jgi:tetratricopeptide (TPR) repeat protein
MVVMYAFLAGLHTVGDFDAGWQIATGRYVIEHHSIPSTDILSYTARGAAWIYPIFSGIALYLVFAKLRWAGLSWLCALVAAIVIWMITRRREVATVALAMLAVPLIADRATPRADLFTLMLLPAFLLVLIGARESAKSVFWAAPLLMIVWVNTHPGFIFGLALLAWYLVAEIIDLKFVRLRKNLPWVLVTAAAVLVNPWGIKVLAQWGAIFFAISRPHGVPTLQMEAFIGEFSPTRFSVSALFGTAGLVQGVATAFIVIGAAGLLFLVWRRRYAESLLLLGATYGALRYLRFQSLAAIVVVIVLGRALDECFAENFDVFSGRLRETLSVVLILLAAVFSAQYVSNRYYVMSSSTSQFGAGLSWWFPERAAEFMKREAIPGQLFHEYNVGGFVALRFAPEYPDYIDGRGGPFGSKMFLEQGLLLRQPADSPAWQEMADRRGVNALMFSLARFGGLGSVDVVDFCRSKNWRPIYLDEVSLVLLRNVPQNRRWIDRLEVGCATKHFAVTANSKIDAFNQLSNQASLMYVLGRDQEALAALHDAEKIYPCDPNTHLTRGQIFQAEGRTREAEAEYSEALHRKQTDTAWLALGGLLASEGKLSESREAFRQAAKLSPHPYGAYKSVGQLSNAMSQPDEALKSFDRAEAESPYKGEAEALGTEFLALLDQGRAEAWRQKGDAAKAVDFQYRAVQRTPLSQKRWADLAKLLDASGRTQEAEQAMTRARALSPAK